MDFDTDFVAEHLLENSFVTSVYLTHFVCFSLLHLHVVTILICTVIEIHKTFMFELILTVFLYLFV